MYCNGLERDILSVYPYREENIQEMLCRLYSILIRLQENGNVVDPELIKHIAEQQKINDTAIKELIKRLDAQDKINAGNVQEITILRSQIEELRKAINSGGGGLLPNGGDCWKDGYMSAKGFRYMKGWEGFGKYAYPDSGGYMTIAYGVTQHAEPVDYEALKKKQPIDEDEGSQVSYKVLRKNYGQPVLRRCLEVGVTKQHQFDAICSFVYNLGLDMFRPGRTIYDTMKKNINNEDAIRDAFNLYVNAPSRPGGPLEPQPGLIKRRKEEGDMFFGKYTKRPIDVIITGGQYHGLVTDNGGDGWLPSGCGGGTGNGDSGQSTRPTTVLGQNWSINGAGYSVEVYAPCTGEVTFVGPNDPHNVSSFIAGTRIKCDVGDLVYAPFDFVVEESKDLSLNAYDEKGDYGRYIKGKIPGKDIKVWFAYLSERWVNKGDEVKKGWVIGKVGNTGNAPKLPGEPNKRICHFEMRKGPGYRWNVGQETDAIRVKQDARIGDNWKGPTPKQEDW